MYYLDWLRFVWWIKSLLHKLGREQEPICRLCGQAVAWDYMGHHIKHYHPEHWDDWREWEEKQGGSH